MMDTKAWRSLNPDCRQLYVEIARRYNGYNNGRIPYSVRQACADLHIGKATASRAFRTLQERGFIVVMQKGAFSWKTRRATEWRLTEFVCDVTNGLPTKEFARWSSGNLEAGIPSRTIRSPEPNQSVPVAEPTDA
jgi:DNA-binding transcriptional MocR family regulator